MVARHDQLIADDGKGRVARDTVVENDFDVTYQVMPDSGSTAAP